MSIEKQLTKLGERLRAVHGDLAVSSEQLSFLSEVADEARTKMVVSETPLSQRDYKDAQGDLDRHHRNHERLQKEIALLEAQRDRLLERLQRET